MPALPNPGMTFTPLDPLPASDLNDLVENIEALNDGTSLPSGDADNTNVAASQTTTSTSYTALATAQAVTIDVGATGLLLVGVGAGNTTNGSNLAKTFMSFALSGANTLAASDSNAAKFQPTSGGVEGSVDRTILLTGLTPGSTTVTAQFRVETGGGGAGTGTWVNRNLFAIPL